MAIMKKIASATSLSGNELYLMADKDFTPGRVVVGNSVVSRGFMGTLGSFGQGVIGGEIEPVTQAVQEGRLKAFERMYAEAESKQAAGIAPDKDTWFGGVSGMSLDRN